MAPKLIAYGDFYLPTYGVLVVLAFLAGLAITVRLARRSGINPELITNLAIYCALAGLLGAKILMIVFDWSHFVAQPKEIFSISTLQAAGVFQGGLLLGILTAFLYVRRYGLPWLETADAFAPGLALGHAIGRLGCFAAGCCWGIACRLPWAVTFHHQAANTLTGVPLEVPLHPSQLYEFGTEALLFVFLYWAFGRPHTPGKIFGLYLLISSVARFAIDFTRFQDQALPFGLPLSITQWIAIALAGVGAMILLRPSEPLPAVG